MSIFDTLMNDRVTLIKKADGQRILKIKASVQKNKIFVDDARIPIEEGDIFERTLPSGVVETFTVTDPGFIAGSHGMPSHYQITVRKGTAAPRPEVPQTQVVHMYGPNSRVNNASTDNSTNIAIQEHRELFAQVRNAVQSSALDTSDIQRLVERIDAMETAAGKPEFADRYTAFIAAAANHMSIIAPFIPALGRLCGVNL